MDALARRSPQSTAVKLMEWHCGFYCILATLSCGISLPLSAAWPSAACPLSPYVW